MTININTTSAPLHLTLPQRFWEQQSQSSKTAAPDKKVDQLPQDSATINSVGDLVAAPSSS